MQSELCTALSLRRTSLAFLMRQPELAEQWGWNRCADYDAAMQNPFRHLNCIFVIKSAKLQLLPHTAEASWLRRALSAGKITRFAVCVLVPRANLMQTRNMCVCVCLMCLLR